MPHLFDEYRAHLRETGAAHSAAELRRWIGTLTSLGVFGATITHGPVPEVLPVGRGADVRIQAENRSRSTWDLGSHGPQGVRLSAVLRRDGREATDVEVLEAPQGPLPPGRNAEWTLRLPKDLPPGRHRLDVDLLDEAGVSFRQMLGEGVSEWMVVQ